MESYINVNPKEFQKFKNVVAEEPVVMLNLLRYKEKIPETGESGKTAYNRYMKAATPFLKKINAQVLFFGIPQHMLIGPTEETLWDAVLLVRYPSFSDFIAMTKAEGYPAHLRELALSDSRLIHCKSIL